MLSPKSWKTLKQKPWEIKELASSLFILITRMLCVCWKIETALKIIQSLETTMVILNLDIESPLRAASEKASERCYNWSKESKTQSMPLYRQNGNLSTWELWTFYRIGYNTKLSNNIRKLQQYDSIDYNIITNFMLAIHLQKCYSDILMYCYGRSTSGEGSFCLIKSQNYALFQN